MFRYLLLATLLPACAAAQITITAADMPVVNDTLRYSNALPTSSSLNLTNTGPNAVWDFSTLTAVTQGVDTYKTAAAVNITYGLTISFNAYGYKVGDSLAGTGGMLPITIEQVYNFFSKKNSPSRYVTEGFAAKIGGAPTPINYSDEDELYLFPLDYNDVDSTTFRLAFSLQPFGGFVQKGYRKTRVDGWGTITTPFFTMPVQALRVRAEIVEIDSVTFGTTSVGIPRTTIEYKWLVNGQHYPALYVTASKAGPTEQVTRVSYRDTKRALAINNVSTAPLTLQIAPNPGGGLFTLNPPAGWQSPLIQVFDASGKCVSTQTGGEVINLQAFPAGHYIVRASCGDAYGFTRLVKL